ncbi:sensor histidine kinase [Streptomyces sp. CA-251251]|uniref:sensor histidine kinase n=1 Tax=Streptomyces sp. CA-251251 TaxID=3240063 RepID=UPI003D8B5155
MHQNNPSRPRRAVLRDVAVIGASAAATAVSALYADRADLRLYPQLLTSRGVNLAPGTMSLSLSVPLLSVLLSCCLLWWRRSRPAAVAVILIGLCTLVPVVPAAAIALFTVASRCDTPTTRWTTAAGLLPIPLCLAVKGTFDSPHMAAAVSGTLVVLGSVGWGLFVRSLRERALRAEQESELNAAQARHREREAIAREMHDVLAHRLSLLSVHAGALKFNPHAPTEQIQQAADVVAVSARQAMEDLRQVLGVLRTPLTADATDRAEPPQPTLGDLRHLIAENREAGMDVEVDLQLTQAEQLDDFTSRTVYRIVQEALTNARKHAPGEQVRVALTGAPGEGLTLEIVNTLGESRAQGAPVGAGLGLIGLAERAALAGGRLTYGADTGRHSVLARLPWNA